MAENNTANLPIWCILALVSGFVTLIALFTDMIGVANSDYSIVFQYAGAAMMKMDIFNGAKYAVIVIGVLALALIIYAVHSMYTIRAGGKMEKAQLIVGITAGLILILAIVFIILVSTGNVYTGDAEGFSAHAGAGLWLMVVGSLPALVGVALYSRE